MAIHHAAELLLIRNAKNIDITFLSDSQATILALKKSSTSSKSVADCITTLNKLASQNIVTIKWIPGHEGYEGNELADTLAKQGTTKPSELIPYQNLPKAYAELTIDRNIDREILTSWKSLFLSPHAKSLINVLLIATKHNIKKLASNILKLNIEDIKILTKTISGHNNLNYHLNTTGFAPSKHCPHCPPVAGIHDYETYTYILCECPAFSRTRQTHYGKTSLEEKELNQKSNIDSTIRKIIKFMKCSKTLDKIPKRNKNKHPKEKRPSTN